MHEAIERFADAVDELQRLDWHAFNDVTVLDNIRDLELHRRRLATIDHAACAQVRDRSLAGLVGARNAASVLVQLLRIPAAEAGARMRAAYLLGPRTAPTGEPLAAHHPRLAAAQSNGGISAAHARVITDCLHRLPDSVTRQLLTADSDDPELNDLLHLIQDGLVQDGLVQDGLVQDGLVQDGISDGIRDGNVGGTDADGQVGIDGGAARGEVTATSIGSVASASTGDVLEAMLLSEAAHSDPVRLQRTGSRIHAWLDPDGPPDPDHRRRLRGLTLHRRPDGSATLSGDLTAEAAEHLEVALEHLTYPGRGAAVAGAESGGTDPDTTRPDTTRPDTALPEATRPDTTRPDASRPDATRPDGADGTELGPIGSGRIVGRDGVAIPGGAGEVAGGEPRTRGQRLHDALLELCRSAMRTGVLPDTAGVSATVIVHLDEHAYATGGRCPHCHTPATAATGHNQLVRADDALTWAGADHEVIAVGYSNSDSGSGCDFESALVGVNEVRVIVVGVNELGADELGADELGADELGVNEVGVNQVGVNELDASRSAPRNGLGLRAIHRTLRPVAAYSDKHRIFTTNQRLAMIARDRGCTFPGCDAPPAWTEAMHFGVDHTVSGSTTINDGALGCSTHHRHHVQMGWRPVMINRIPHWIPPRWIDPDQRPRRNDVHQPVNLTSTLRSIRDAATASAARDGGTGPGVRVTGRLPLRR